MKIAYIEKSISQGRLQIIDQANEIIEKYQSEGYDLTLRQLYYQFVSKDLIENTEKSYKRLGNIISDGRLCGLINWNAIVDRTRNLEANSHWEHPSEIIESCAKQFRIDLWEGQKFRPEVFIEKDALVGVISRVCEELDVPYFSCRGYTSQSAMWNASRRFQHYIKKGQDPFIIHLGDHDPSGIDMTRDIIDRLQLFLGQNIKINRIALNMSQVEQYSPPPNPTKLSDSRAKTYIKKFGYDSWELDALDPRTISTLIRETVMEVRDEKKWETMTQQQNHFQKSLESISQNYTVIEQNWGKL